MKKEILNIIVAGTGGQGVITLSNTIRKLAVLNGYGCEGATFKGGAQRMGSVYSELRLIPNSNKKHNISSQIMPGEVDILMGLEPWETLRFANLCHTETCVISNSTLEKLYVERLERRTHPNPIPELEKLFKNLIISDYSTQSMTETGHKKQANMYLLKAAIAHRYLPFTNDQLNQLA